MNDDTSQPKPLRLIAALGGLCTTVTGLLPVFGVSLTPEQVGGLGAIVSAVVLVVGVAVGESKVTPVAAPRDDEGRRLVPEADAQ